MARFWQALFSFFSRSRKNRSSSTEKAGRSRSFVSFQETGEVIRAERLLQEAGFSVEVMGPPPWLRRGCDMGIVCNAVEEPAIRTTLAANNLHPEDVLPLAGDMLAPVSLVHTVDYGAFFMVRAANMKITIAWEDGRICNVSGGGCPDVPYLAGKLLGRSICDAEEPRTEGQTLCSYALQKAFLEGRRQWQEAKNGSS
ncbi:MAG: DUF3343 domain-containing protein [Desulfovibrio sp.]|nr:DUF3343 domain-containing protein [Desulfovibrio sp.]